MKKLMNSLNGTTLLKDWSHVTITGLDATHFLQNQLTISVNNLPIVPSGRLARVNIENKFCGYCTAKGRLLASFWISRLDVNEYHLLLSSDVADLFIKKLSMYILRSEVKIAKNEDLMLVGSYFSYENPINQHHESYSYELPTVTYDSQTIHREVLVYKDVLEPPYSTLDNSEWNWLEILSGYPRISTATTEQFVPQMINLESLFAIDFKKGCYPGQEIVARSQYRGTIKRRLQLAYLKCQDKIVPGLEIYSKNDPNQPCGMIVLAAENPYIKDEWYIQFECKTELINSEMTIHNNSSIIKLVPLPYSLMEI